MIAVNNIELVSVKKLLSVVNSLIKLKHESYDKDELTSVKLSFCKDFSSCKNCPLNNKVGHCNLVELNNNFERMKKKLESCIIKSEEKIRRVVV